MIDYLKLTFKVPTTVSGKAVGMDKFKIHNIRRGASSATLEDIALLAKIYPQAKHIATDHGINVAEIATVQEPQHNYSPIKQDPTLTVLLRLEAGQQELLKHLVQRSQQDAETISRLLALLEQQNDKKLKP